MTSIETHVALSLRPLQDPLKLEVHLEPLKADMKAEGRPTGDLDQNPTKWGPWNHFGIFIGVVSSHFEFGPLGTYAKLVQTRTWLDLMDLHLCWQLQGLVIQQWSMCFLITG